MMAETAPNGAPPAPATDLSGEGRSADAHLPDAPIVFYDGVCGLCNRLVDFLLRRDRAGVFRLAPLQGETARRYVSPEDIEHLTSMVLVDERGVWRKSSAALRILFRLGPFWKTVAAIAWLVPRPLRDVAYGALSRSRYRLFGKKETCRMPTPEERARFLP